MGLITEELRIKDDVEERALQVYKELKESFQRMDIIVDEPVFASNPRKKGNIGIRCTTIDGIDEAWVVIRRSGDVLELVPPLFNARDRSHFTNLSSDKNLCDLLNRIVHEYVLDNKDMLFNNNFDLIYDMEDLLKQLHLISKDLYKFNNIEIARSSFHRDYISLEVRCRNKNSLLDEDPWNIDFYVPMVITKNPAVAERRSSGWASNTFTNRDDIYILINKKTLKTFNRVLKDTMFKDIYHYTTKTNLMDKNSSSMCEGNYR